jgi:LysR family transcriptional activator of nhaA
MNFKHLQYFWVTARAGGVTRASEQLHMTPQTLSGQIKLLEERLGKKLFRKSGRRLELTDEGRTALRYADEIFTLGGEMEAALRDLRTGAQVLEFRVGVADSVAKSVACRLLAPALKGPDPVRLVCREGLFPDLVAQLALHRIDLVIADEPLTQRLSVKAFNHPLGQSPTSFFCEPRLLSRLQGEFPGCLDGSPLLLQGAASPVRQQFEAWQVRLGLRPRVVGEFDDGALMKSFGREGLGVFMAASVLEEEIVSQYGVACIGRVDDITENFYAISAERRITHPAVAAIAQAAHLTLST